MNKILLTLTLVVSVGLAAYSSQLTTSTTRAFEVDSHLNTLPVGAVNVYRGSAVGLTDGYARQLVAGDTFKGFAEETKENSAGAAGDLNVSVRHRGIILLTVDTAGIAHEGQPVYARDGNTFVLNQETTNSRIGTIHRFVLTNTVMVKFNADAGADLTGITQLAGTLTGTITGTNVDTGLVTTTNLVGAGSVNTSITNINLQIKELQSKVNELILLGR